MKARVAIYNLCGKALIWSKHYEQVKNVKINIVDWEKFQKYFRKE